MAKITLENEFGIYSIDTHLPTEQISDMFENLIVPMLHAVGYHPETVESYVEGKEISEPNIVWEEDDNVGHKWEDDV